MSENMNKLITGIVFEVDQEFDPEYDTNKLHDDLCKAIHEKDQAALDRLSLRMVSIWHPCIENEFDILKEV